MVFTLTAAALLLSAPAGGLISGPQVGSALPGPFEPLHLTGPDAGDEACLYCKYGNAPVVMVFARKVSPELETLLKKLETAASEHREAKLGACAIVLDASEDAKKSARKLAERANLRETILACIDAGKIAEYQLSADAEITVLLYNKRTVRVNYAFRSGELNEQKCAKIIGDLPAILPAK